MFAAGSAPLNRYPLWKYLMLLAMVIFGILYALPNIYGEAPSIQISTSAPGIDVDEALLQDVNQRLTQSGVSYLSSTIEGHFIQVRFADTTEQLKAQDVLLDYLHADDFVVAISLAPATPNWLRAIGAEPMKYGLDLRGGVHFLLDVDVDSILNQRMNGFRQNIRELLRDEGIRARIVALEADSILVELRDQSDLSTAYTTLRQSFVELIFERDTSGGNFNVIATLTSDALNQLRSQVLDQTMLVLRNRVDELGVSNAVVQRQGASRVSVDLPGVLDAGQAKQILGGTATLEFRIVDDRDPSNFAGTAPAGTKLYDFRGFPVLIQNDVVLHGSSITSAFSTIGEDGRPEVNIRLGGGGESRFNRITRANIGRQLAIIYIETKIDVVEVEGEEVRTQRKIERVISAPNIESALGASFRITGIEDSREAYNLAVTLRAGALPAAIDIVQERTVGPTLGKENVDRGLISIALGFILVVLFMAFYYRTLGVFAGIALIVNLILLVAILSALGMVLTLPGIAGIVLNIGMAVDANVLIFERIREELRNGVTPQAAIHAGFNRAFTAIIDANVTTLIAAIALFGIGTGPIKGFAITLTIGILTSMITAIMGTRAMVNMAYGGKQGKKVSVGI